MNAVLGWHGSTLRAGSTLTLFNRILAPFRGAKGDEHIVEKLSLPMLRDSLQVPGAGRWWCESIDWPGSVPLSHPHLCRILPEDQ